MRALHGTHVEFNQGTLTEREGSVQLTPSTNQFRQAIFVIENVIYYLTKQVTPIEEVNRTEPSPSVGVPWFNASPSFVLCQLKFVKKKF